MPKNGAVEEPKKTYPALAAVLAWIIPGAGHWYTGRPVRAVILFVVIQALFWAGVAIGGVFTVNPIEEAWWARAQLCTGASGIYSWYRQARASRKIDAEAARLITPGSQRAYSRLRPDMQQEAMRQQAQDVRDKVLAAHNLALVAPTSDIAMVFSGVAGMLNLLCIFDALMLSLMGRHGEPGQEPQT